MPVVPESTTAVIPSVAEPPDAIDPINQLPELGV
jgi:hypothetical protein